MVRDLKPDEETGTTVRFWPDADLRDRRVQLPTLSSRLRELAFLNSGVEISLADERTDESSTFLFEGGIREFVEYLNETKTALHDDVIYYDDERSEGIRSKSPCRRPTTCRGRSTPSLIPQQHAMGAPTHLTGE